MAVTEAFVTPGLIRWARLRHRLETDSAAQRVNVKEDTFKAWESGDARPTLRQAQTLADKLNVPLGYLFLPSPPKEELPIPDLRTVAGAPPMEPSPDFIDLLYDVIRKQQWYREYLESQGARVVPFVGRYQSEDDPEEIAADIRHTLPIDVKMRQASPTWEYFLREFIRRAESAGVLVMRSGIVKNYTRRKLEVEEFRGFAIVDSLAPLVFINGKDAKAAQIFTLGHELAHLWIGVGGVSNPDYSKKSAQQNNSVERLCNRVAAEVLVPKREFLTRWNDYGDVPTNLQALAARFRVSTWVILRQAYDLGKLDDEEYSNHFAQLQNMWQDKESGKEDVNRGNFYATFFVRNSKTLTSALIAAVEDGRVLHRDAARLLNVKVRILDEIAQRILKEPSAGG